jgi:hypothetical protein
MAGAGWRQFTVGQLLTSAQVQTFLQDQAVQVFASAAARTSALGTAVSEGMVSYRTDGKALELYANSAWTPVSQNRNILLNSAFDIWQRGTSFSHTGPSVIYMADRWGAYRAGFAAGSSSSRQASGLTGFQYSARIQRDSGNTSTATLFFTQALETINSLPFAGQTMTFSFYARAGANFSGSALASNFVSGTGTDQTMWAGFTGYQNITSISSVISTSWQRFTFTGTVPTNSTQLAVLFNYAPSGTAGANDWFEVTGVKVELGAVATPFVRATTTLQGELAACQRYYTRFSASAAYSSLSLQGFAASTTLALVRTQLPVTMRVAPTAIDFSTLGVLQTNGVDIAVSAAALSGRTTANSVEIETTSTGLTADRGYALIARNSATAFIGFSAEL